MKLILWLTIALLAANAVLAVSVLVPDGACFTGSCCTGWGGSKSVTIQNPVQATITQAFSDDKITVYVNGQVVYDENPGCSWPLGCNPPNHASAPNVNFALPTGTNTIQVVASCPWGCSSPNGCIEFTYTEQAPAPQQPACGNGKVETGEECDGPAQQVSTQVLPPGLVGWWKAEDNAEDFSGNGNNGQLINGATFAEGKIGQAFSFNTATSSVTVPDSVNLRLGKSHTIAAWIYPKAYPPDWARIVGKDGVPPRNYGLWLSYAGTVFFQIEDATAKCNAVWPSPGIAPLNSWTHVAGTYDGNHMLLYVNGVFAGDQPCTISPPISNAPLTIGSPNWGWNSAFQGLIDEAQVYNRALSASEIQALATGIQTSTQALGDPCKQLYSDQSTCQSDCKCSQPTPLPPVELPCGNGKLDPGEDCDWNAPDSCGPFKFCYACVCRPTGNRGYAR